MLWSVMLAHDASPGSDRFSGRRRFKVRVVGHGQHHLPILSSLFCTHMRGDKFVSLTLDSICDVLKLKMRYTALAPQSDDLQPRGSYTRLCITIGTIIFTLTGLALFSSYTFYEVLQNHLCTTPYFQITNFQPTQDYQTLSEHDDGRWAQLIPANGGFQIQPMHENNSYRLGIGMFHELHCLRMLRNRLQSLTQRVELLSNVTDPDYPSYVREPIDSVHVLHCLDYLRQVSSQDSIYCHV